MKTLSVLHVCTHNARFIDSLKHVVGKFARWNEATIGDLPRPHRVSDSTQLIRLIAFRFVRQSCVHRAPDGGPNPVASYEEIARRRDSICKGHHDGLSGAGGLSVRFEALGEVEDLVGRAEMLDEDFLDVRAVERFH